MTAKLKEEDTDFMDKLGTASCALQPHLATCDGCLIRGHTFCSKNRQSKLVY